LALLCLHCSCCCCSLLPRLHHLLLPHLRLQRLSLRHPLLHLHQLQLLCLRKP
jgi:hypothetical protein